MSKSKCEHHDHGRILLITPDMIADLCPTGSLAQRQPCVFHFGSFPVQGDHDRFLVVVPSPTAPGVRSFESEIVFVNRPELVVWIENMIKLVAGGNTGAFAGSEVYTGFMGVSGEYATAPGATGEAVGANKDADGKYSGLKLNYTMGQLVFMLDQQTSKSPYVASGSSFDRSAVKVGAAYKYNATSLVSLQTWSKKRTDNTGAGFSGTTGSAKDSGYGIVVKHDLGGNWLAHAQWGKANNLTGTSVGEIADSGATAYSLGFTKAFSKRTHVYTAYHQINNSSAAAYNMSGGNYSSAAAVGAGADVKVLALGMIHNF